jgi:hypothetical protein
MGYASYGSREGRCTVIAAVTGGQEYRPTQAELDWLVSKCEQREVTELRHGAAKGVDQRAAAEVSHRLAGVAVRPFPAQWRTTLGYNARAGLERNSVMLFAAPAVEILFAFPGDTGTAHCVRTAQSAGIEVVFSPL